jgi:hypothetical protein
MYQPFRVVSLFGIAVFGVAWGLTLTAVFSLSAVLFTGCSTGNSFKMPSLGWGKKKSDSSSLASNTPSTNLPAPPSTSATPNQVPDYSGNSDGRAANGTANAPSNYNMASRSNTYGNPAPGYAANNAAAQGFYSSQYDQGGSANRNGYGQAAAGQSGSPAAYGAAAATNPYGTPAQPASAGVRSYATDAYNTQSSGGAGSQYANGYAANPAPASASIDSNSNVGSYSSGGYRQDSASTGSYQQGRSGASQSYNAGASAAQAAPSGQVYGQQQPVGNAAAPSTNVADYRPGSTGRTTPYGDSNNLSVPTREGVEPASFAGSEAPSSTNYPSTGVGSNYSRDPYSPARTANGTSPSAYPNTYQR